MLDLERGDRIEVLYEDAPLTTISGRVVRVLSDREEGMSAEVEEYIASWIEIIVDEPGDTDAKQCVLLGTDCQYRLNGRQVTIRKM